MNKEVMTGSYIDYKNDNKAVGFNFYTNLRKCEKSRFVNIVTNILVGDSYDSVLRDMIFDFTIITMFTDVDVSEIEESSNSLILIEDLLDDTNIVDIVKANVVDGLIEELDKAVDKNIEYRTGIRINRLEDALTKLLNTIEKKVDTIDTSYIMELAEKLSGISGDITPERIVEAYSKTEAFKNNMNEVNTKRQKAFEIARSITQSIDKK